VTSSSKGDLKMKKTDIMKAFLDIAEKIGNVTHASIHDTWVSVNIVQDDGTKCSLDFNIFKKEEKNDGN
jgi:hypothetical protein